MIIPLPVVAVAFTLATIFCVIDMVMVRHLRRRSGRFFQGMIYAAAAYYYWIATINAALPSVEIRLVWLAISISVISEIISRWQFGGNHS